MINLAPDLFENMTVIFRILPSPTAKAFPASSVKQKNSTTNCHVWYRLLSCLCFASYKYSHHSIIIATSFGHTFSTTTSFQFVSGRVCIMAITRAGAITAAAKAVSKSRENEKRRKSAARKRKWRERQSAEQQSEIRQTNLMGHTEGCACLPKEQ